MNKNDKNSFESYEKKVQEEFKNSTIFTVNDKTEKKKKAHKNKSYIKLLCALLCFLIVVGASIFSVAKFWNVDNIATTTQSESKGINLTADANVKLSDMKNVSKDSVCNVSKVVIKNKNGVFNFKPYKTTVKSDDQTSSEEIYYKLLGIDSDIPIDDTFSTDLCNKIFEITALKKLEGSWSEKDCGLDNPNVIINVAMADNSEFNVKIGDVSGINSNYYISTSLKEGIYVAESTVYDDFSVSLNHLVDYNLFNAITENDAPSNYFSNGKLFVYDSIEINGKNFSNVKLSYSDSDDEVMKYIITSPLNAYADDEKISSLLSPLSSGLMASSVYKIKPDIKDIKKYGLDNPYLQISYNINGKNYIVKFSKPGQSQSNYCACMVNDVPIIYSVLSEQISFIDWNINDLRFNMLYLRKIDTINSLKASYNGKNYKYELSFDDIVQKPGETSSAQNQSELTVILNSSPIDSDNFKTAYQRITMATATKYLEKNIDLNKRPSLTLEFELANGKKDVITYTKYNNNYYLHKLNGIGDELIPARTIDSLILNLEKLRKGEEIISPNNQQ